MQAHVLNHHRGLCRKLCSMHMPRIFMPSSTTKLIFEAQGHLESKVSYGEVMQEGGVGLGFQMTSLAPLVQSS